MLHQPCIRSSTADHDSFSELPFQLQGEAGRSINLSMEFLPPSANSGYPACEPAAAAALLRVASNTAVSPTSVRERLWPPHCGHGEISTVDNLAAILDQTGRSSERPEPASSASWSCPAC